MKILIALVVALAAHISWAASFVCPLQKQKLKFRTLGVFDGNPKELAQLKPDNGDDPLPHHWTLGSDNVWVTCAYGDAGKVLISKKLGRKVSSCVTVETKIGLGFNALDCK